MKDFFKELLEYNHTCNQKVWNIFNENPKGSSENAIKLFSHILNAHHIWNCRINSIQETYGVWELQPIQQGRDIDKANYENSLLILKNVDLNQMITYTNTRGLVFNNSIRDTLFHVINHSTYHRAQIATDFRENGLVPLMTDYILHKR